MTEDLMKDLNIHYTKHLPAFKQFVQEATHNKSLSSSSHALLEHIYSVFSEYTKTLPRGARYFRATDNRCTPMKKEDFWPIPLGTPGRANDENQCFLYMGNMKEVCLYEKNVSPDDSNALALAEMQIEREQRVAYIQKEPNWHNHFFPEEEDEFIHLIVSIFHRAVADSEPENYRPTQHIAKRLLKHGIDGIIYRSGKAPVIEEQVPLNIVLFDRCAASAISYEEVHFSKDYSLEIKHPARSLA